MKWLIQLATNDDPISACRLMNIFRRKWIRIDTLAMVSRPAGLTLFAVVEFAESELGHLFNYLRRTEGVEGVAFYRPEPAGEASFVFVDAEAGSAGVAQLLKAFPEFKLIFASQGKYLLQLPPGDQPPAVISGIECMPFARVMSSEDFARPEPVGAATER